MGGGDIHRTATIGKSIHEICVLTEKVLGCKGEHGTTSGKDAQVFSVMFQY